MKKTGIVTPAKDRTPHCRRRHCTHMRLEAALVVCSPSQSTSLSLSLSVGVGGSGSYRRSDPLSLSSFVVYAAQGCASTSQICVRAVKHTAAHAQAFLPLLTQPRSVACKLSGIHAEHSGTRDAEVENRRRTWPSATPRKW